jgi:hypothetical protein
MAASTCAEFMRALFGGEFGDLSNFFFQKKQKTPPSNLSALKNP